MAVEGFKRRLATILCADVEGYSRLMDDDEGAFVCTLKGLRSKQVSLNLFLKMLTLNPVSLAYNAGMKSMKG